MKFLKHILKDIGDTGKPISDFRKKLVSITDIISSLSYHDTKFSENLTRQKLQVEVHELVEIADRCPIDSEVRIYLKPTTIETNIAVSILAVQKWIDYVIVGENLFTNNSALTLIRLAEQEINMQDKSFLKPKPISKIFPILFKYKYLPTTLSAIVEDNSLRMELRFSTSTYISYNDPRNSNQHYHTIIEKNIYGDYFWFEEYYYVLKDYSRKVTSKKYKLEKDHKLDYYKGLDHQLYNEISLLKAGILNNKP